MLHSSYWSRPPSSSAMEERRNKALLASILRSWSEWHRREEHFQVQGAERVLLHWYLERSPLLRLEAVGRGVSQMLLHLESIQ